MDVEGGMEVDNEKVKAFVKGTLGCGCDDALFEDVEAREGMQDDGFDREYLIGQRLLVRTVSPTDKQALLKTLPMLVATGFDEREKRALNRFRLVVFSEQPKEMEAAVLPLFVRLSQVDDRVHLHVLPLDEKRPSHKPATAF